MGSWLLQQMMLGKRSVEIGIRHMIEFGNLHAKKEKMVRICNSDCGDGYADAVYGGGYVCSYFLSLPFDVQCALFVVLCCVVFVRSYLRPLPK